MKADDTHVRVEMGEVRVHPPYGTPVVVEVGCGQPVTIDKMFGPLIFTDIRVMADFQSCEWVIERKRIDSGAWIEVLRVPGQLDDEFSE